VILVEHATVVTVDALRRIFADGSVLVEGSRILQVGPSREVRPPREPDRVIDGSRLVVTPGFVDTHVHLSEHLNRGLLLDDIPVDRYLPDWLIPLYSVMTAEDEQHAALLAGIEMIRTGTTTFCEAGTLFDTGAVADAVERLGMRAILGRWTWDLESGPDRMRQTTAEALASNEAMLEELGSRSGLVRGWPLLLGFGTCSEELIRGAKALADRYGVGWGMMHLASHPSRRTGTVCRSRRWTRGACSRRTPSSPTWSISTTPTSHCSPGAWSRSATVPPRGSSTPRASPRTRACRRWSGTESASRWAATAATGRTTSTCCG
jgi:5-methylthioadenosine/S-adenosylhomocysteine deaminase